MKISCFLPCRAGSERIPKKNIKPFANFEHGLIEIKLNQLARVEFISNIILSTNDLDIIRFASNLKIDNLYIDHRHESLCTSQTSTDDLIKYAGQIINDGHILWTHVTSPFITSKLYDKIINQYFNCLTQDYDSLMTTTLIKSFVWDGSQPINYKREIEKWPRTQTIRPLHEINSGVFICDSSIYQNLNDRIGRRPLLYPLGKVEGFDIDWEEDFIIAELFLQKGLTQL